MRRGRIFNRNRIANGTEIRIFHQPGADPSAPIDGEQHQQHSGAHHETGSR